MTKIKVDDFDDVGGESAEWLDAMAAQLDKAMEERARAQGRVAHFGKVMARELVLACIAHGYVPICEREE